MSAPYEGKAEIYEGKAKVVYESENPGQVYMVFKDSATAFDGKKKGAIEGKGRLNAAISEVLFGYLGKCGVKTHFISKIDEVTLKVKRLKIFPIEVVVRNVVAGSLSKRSGKPEGSPLPFPLLELYCKSDDLGDPMWNDDHALAFGACSREELLEIKDVARKVNHVLRPFFARRGLILVDLKLELGRIVGDGNLGEIVVGDEISPDTCRLWDEKTSRKMDKDRFRRDLGDVEGAYAEVLNRISQGAVE